MFTCQLVLVAAASVLHDFHRNRGGQAWRPCPPRFLRPWPFKSQWRWWTASTKSVRGGTLSTLNCCVPLIFCFRSVEKLSQYLEYNQSYSILKFKEVEDYKWLNIMHLFLPYTDNMMQHPTGFVLAGPNIIAFRPVARIVLKGGEVQVRPRAGLGVFALPKDDWLTGGSGNP